VGEFDEGKDFIVSGMALSVLPFHWFFLAQDAGLPERLLTVDPDAFTDRVLTTMTPGRNIIESAALEAYRFAFRNPRVRHAICEDCRPTRSMNDWCQA
jgi:haloacetate dehalogenase